MIAIIDYGLGNVQAFQNVYKRLNVDVVRATTPNDLNGATHIILPGVGAFDHAMERLTQSGLREALDEIVLRAGVPVLGVCVGMQILASSSDEGIYPGLEWVAGRVRKFATDGPAAPRLPHMGWNDVQPAAVHPLFAGLESDAKFYFLHSYYFECTQREHVAAVTDYGFEFSSAVSAGNIHGVQFHPEKSHHYGIRLLKNFAEL